MASFLECITISVSDGRQPPLTFKLRLSQTQTAASRSLDALVERSRCAAGE